MAQSLPQVLRLHRTERNPNPEYILIHVGQEGPNRLDVKLTGTDQEYVYVVSLKHNKISSLQTKGSRISQEQWEHILSFILLGQLPEGEDLELTHGLEAITTVTAEKNIKITVQRRIEGITQKLGEVTLSISEEEADVFAWIALTIEARDVTKQELQSIKADVGEKDEQIKLLQSTLDELAKLKNEHENQLLEKFALLLNEKKLKIRDQQRLLASSTVDPVKLEEVASTRGNSAGPSRATKRKGGVAQIESDEESDGGYEKMDVDPPAQESEKEEERTASDTESDSDPPPLSPPRRATRAATAEPKPATKAASKSPPKDVEPPPKRELPFSKKPPSKPAPPPADGSETESDDEL